MKQFDAVALGELLIDFTEHGQSEQGNPLLEANPGGAPCNVLAMLARLGNKTAFVGKVGDDALGNMLKNSVHSLGIDAAHLLLDEKYPTTLAFVHRKPDGDRAFSFYRNPTADTMLTPDEIPADLIANSKIFHFGTLSMTHPEVRAATIKALDAAKQSDCIISFDPNLREPLWETLDKAKQAVEVGLSYATVLKISDNEIQWLTGIQDYERAAKQLQQQYAQLKIIFVTLGKAGSFALAQNQFVYAAPYLQANTIETTGAGDTFTGAALHFILEYGIEALDKAKILHLLQFANAAASLITTKKGALMVMPTKEEVTALLHTAQR